MITIDMDNLTFEQNRRFNLIAQEIRQEFNSVVESVSMPHVHNINWIVGSIASRNKYISPLFLRLVTLAFVKAEFSKAPNLGRVILSDRPLAKLIKQYFIKQKEKVTVVCSEKLTTCVWRTFRPLRQYLIGIAVFALRFLGRSKPTKERIQDNTAITLIDTFVLNNQSGDEGSLRNGEYKDRYYPGLLECLIEDEKKAVFFLPTIVGFKNPISIFKAIRKANTNFIVHDDFLKLSDYIAALLQPFRLLQCKIKKTSFRDIDITPLLKQEHITKCSEGISLLGILYFRFAYRLAQQNFKVRTLVDWHENQPIDRALIVGFHRFHPKTRVIGYQGYVVAKSLHLYVCPNRTEFLGKAVPDVLCVTGDGLTKEILEFCKDVNVDVAPGFRFQKLWRKRTRYPELGFYTVLVALPISPIDSVNILRTIVDILPKFEHSDVRFFVKPHPTWSPDHIRKLIPGPWPEKLAFRIGDFHDVIETVNLLITNASSVSLEAIAKGVRVVIIGESSGITQNPIPDSVSPSLFSVVYSAVDCADAIKRLWQEYSSDINFNDEKNNILREKYFSPVSRAGVAKLLELDK